MSDILQRIEDLITSSESEIGQLRARITELETEADEQADAERWRWTRHVTHKVDPGARFGLPVPRLQMWCDTQDDGGRTRFRYSLIYQHYADDHFVEVPLGVTESSGARAGRYAEDYARSGELPEPWREAFHIRHDAVSLGLPAFAVFGDYARKLSTITAFRAQRPNQSDTHRFASLYDGPEIKAHQ